jgi:ketosteroid isomerase-like protein
MWADLVSEASAVRRGDDIVIIHHVSGRMTDGSTRDGTVADVFTVRDGQAVKMRAYADPAEALGAAPDRAQRGAAS